jgi:hypothetical protein
MAGSCEHGNEPSGSIKDGKFLGYLSVLLANQEGLCSSYFNQLRDYNPFRKDPATRS